MIHFNEQVISNTFSNQKFFDLKGQLEEKEAKATLGEFLYYNLGVTTELLLGLKIFPFQEIILRNWFDHTFNMNVWTRGGSKCADINTLCLTDRGFQRLKDVEIGQTIFANKEKQTVLAKTINPEELGLTLLTRKGFSITGKNDHRILVFQPDTFTFEYKTLASLNTQKDLVPIKSGMDIEGNLDLVSTFDNSAAHCQEKSIALKNEPDLFYLMGLILGDGCIRRNINEQQNLCSITSADNEILEFVHKKFTEYFPESSFKISAQEDNKASEIRLYHGGFIRFLKHVGFCTAHYAHEKQLPEKILLCSKLHITKFIQGLFDTDGYITLKENPVKNATRAKIGFTSSSEKLIDTLQIILLNFGIVTGKCLIHSAGRYMINGQECDTQNAWTLSLSNLHGLLIFKENIGFGLSRKAQILDLRLSKTVKPIDYNSNLIPVGNYFKKKYGMYYFKKRGYKIHKNLSPNRLYFLINNNLIDDADKKTIKFILDSNFIFDRIRSIERKLTQTIDIQVEKEKCYWGNGFISHNSYLAAIFCCIYPIFFPNTRIVISSNSFRATRRIILLVEKLINAKGATLLKQCFVHKKGELEFVRRADEMTLDINGGQIIALPLNEKIRGTRGDVLLADEFFQIPEDIYKSVLIPFLMAKNNIQEQLDLQEYEDALIANGQLQENQRTFLESYKKVIALSSASYDFEFLYRLYMEWLEKIVNPNKQTLEDRRTYFVSRLSYRALPKELIEKEIIEEVKAGGESTASFQRECMALFSSSSDGYFNIRKLHSCTVKDGDLPCVQLRGTPESKYLVAIDPSFSSSKSSDFFAMGVYLLNPDNRSLIQVHTYGVAGGELKDHIRYLYYILTNFNVVFLIGDFGGANFDFIQTVNESAYFIDRNIKLQFVEGNFDSEDYLTELKNAKNSYRLLDRKFCYRQLFGSEWIRKANEHLQAQIDYEKVWFASRLSAHETMFQKALETEVPVIFKDKNDQEMKMFDFIANQDDFIEQTKRQLALIEVKTTVQGTMQFDLPQHLKRSKSVGRSRRDNYTCLLMACWGAKAYMDMIFSSNEPVYTTFEPIIIR